MSESAPPPLPPLPPLPPELPPAWTPLPARARVLFVLAALPAALPAGMLGFLAVVLADGTLPPWQGAGLGLMVGALFGAWLGTKRYRHTRWRLDEHGLAVRRGRLWQRDTRVPATRVQHLDVKRGPLQRRRRLATVVVHTAGTRLSAVTLPHLDEDDAQRLRDRLARQIDDDDEL